VSEFDVRCSATLGEPTPTLGRCQMFMGHEGGHAVMFTSFKRRVVRSWYRHDTDSAVDRDIVEEQRPWMRGYPLPAWIDLDAFRSADLSLF